MDCLEKLVWVMWWRGSRLVRIMDGESESESEGKIYKCENIRR